MHNYIYIYIYMHIHIYIYTYIHTCKRERERLGDGPAPRAARRGMNGIKVIRLYYMTLHYINYAMLTIITML